MPGTLLPRRRPAADGRSAFNGRDSSKIRRIAPTSGAGQAQRRVWSTAAIRRAAASGFGADVVDTDPDHQPPLSGHGQVAPPVGLRLIGQQVVRSVDLDVDPFRKEGQIGLPHWFVPVHDHELATGGPQTDLHARPAQHQLLVGMVLPVAQRQHHPEEPLATWEPAAPDDRPVQAVEGREALTQRLHDQMGQRLLRMVGRQVREQPIHTDGPHTLDAPPSRHLKAGAAPDPRAGRGGPAQVMRQQHVHRLRWTVSETMQIGGGVAGDPRRRPHRHRNGQDPLLRADVATWRGQVYAAYDPPPLLALHAGTRGGRRHPDSPQVRGAEQPLLVTGLAGQALPAALAGGGADPPAAPAAGWRGHGGGRMSRSASGAPGQSRQPVDNAFVGGKRLTLGGTLPRTRLG